MIYIGENKSALCKGNFHPAQLYKGETKLAGYTETAFEGLGGVTLENCYNDRIYDFYLHGKNLFNIQSSKNKYTGTYGTCEKTENGFRTVCTASVNSFRVNLLIPKEVFEEGKTYCISCDGTNVRMIRVGEASSLKDTSSVFKYGGADGTSCSFTISTITKAYISFLFYSATYNIGDVITVENIQIEEGTTVTEYEPSLNDAVIEVHGKNLFNIQSSKNLYGGQYGTYSKTEKGFKVTCNQSSSAFRMVVLIPKEVFEEGKTYCVSCDGTNVGNVIVGEADALNDTSSFNKYGIAYEIPYSFTPNNITKPYINFYFYSKTYSIGDVITIKNIQIEEGATATEYKPYIEPRTVLLKNGEPAGEIPTFKGTTVIEIETDMPAIISGKYKRREE